MYYQGESETQLEAQAHSVSKEEQATVQEEPPKSAVPQEDAGFVDFYEGEHTIQSIQQSIQNACSSLLAGSLEVKLPTIWTDGKAEVGRVREEKK